MRIQGPYQREIGGEEMSLQAHPCGVTKCGRLPVEQVCFRGGNKRSWGRKDQRPARGGTVEEYSLLYNLGVVTTLIPPVPVSRGNLERT